MKIYNRGISGNKVYQLAERWQADCLDLKPDVLSILIGVNDFWHKLKHGYDGTLENYETDYRALLQRTKDALPNVKLRRLRAVRPEGRRGRTTPGSPNSTAIARPRSTWPSRAGAAFVPFQTMFDLAAKIAPPERWAADGVHPSNDGAALMAHWWLKAAGA